MSNRHGGKRVKIFMYSNERGEVLFEIKEMVYPHSNRAKRFSGCGEWTVWEQKVPHRPAQAFDELFFALRDLDLIEQNAGVLAAVEYFTKDMDLTRVDRRSLVEDYRKSLTSAGK
jgi:hypothetical protein